DQSAYDLIHVDLYQGGPYVPFYLTTREFFQSVRGHLSPGGMLLNNVFDRSESKSILYSTVATMEGVFPTVLVLSDATGSNLLMGFRDPADINALRAKLNAVDQATPAGQFAHRAAAIVRPVTPPQGTVI